MRGDNAVWIGKRGGEEDCEQSRKMKWTSARRDKMRGTWESVRTDRATKAKLVTILCQPPLLESDPQQVAI
jgi:hypothetical protein